MNLQLQFKLWTPLRASEENNQVIKHTFFCSKSLDANTSTNRWHLTLTPIYPLLVTSETPVQGIYRQCDFIHQQKRYSECSGADDTWSLIKQNPLSGYTLTSMISRGRSQINTESRAPFLYQVRYSTPSPLNIILAVSFPHFVTSRL